MTFRLLAACLLFSACLPGAATAPASGEVPHQLVLRSYEVPGGSAERMRSVLRELLWFGSNGKDSNKYVGRADIGPDGRLLVLAPEDVQEGVKNLVASVAKNPVKEPEALTLTYWAVVGSPGEGGERPAALKDLGPALDELEKAEGPMAFSLLEKLVVSSMSGEHGDLMGRDINVRQHATVANGVLTAEVTLQRSGQRVSTRLRLPQDKLVVLASSGLGSKDAADAQKSLVFIVKATAHAGDGR